MCPKRNVDGGERQHLCEAWPRNKIRKNFFVAFVQFSIHDTPLSFILFSIWFNPTQLSLPSAISALLSVFPDRSSTAQPVVSFFVLAYTYASSFIIPLPRHHPSTSFCCVDTLLSTTRSSHLKHLIVLRSWLSCVLLGIQCSWWV